MSVLSEWKHQIALNINLELKYSTSPGMNFCHTYKYETYRIRKFKNSEPKYVLYESKHVIGQLYAQIYCQNIH